MAHTEGTHMCHFAWGHSQVVSSCTDVGDTQVAGTWWGHTHGTGVGDTQVTQCRDTQVLGTHRWLMGTHTGGGDVLGTCMWHRGGDTQWGHACGTGGVSTLRVLVMGTQTWHRAWGSLLGLGTLAGFGDIPSIWGHSRGWGHSQVWGQALLALSIAVGALSCDLSKSQISPRSPGPNPGSPGFGVTADPRIWGWEKQKGMNTKRENGNGKNSKKENGNGMNPRREKWERGWINSNREK